MIQFQNLACVFYSLLCTCILLAKKNVVKDCVNKTETNAPFDHVFWPTEYNDKNHDM